MAGLVPAIYVCLYRTYKTWMPGMTTGHDEFSFAP